MSITVSHTVTVNAPLAEVLAVARDVEKQPTWWPGMLEAEVLETDAEGRCAVGRMVNDVVKIGRDEFRLAYQHSEDSIRWSLVEHSTMQKRQDGSWTFRETGGGTEATVRLDLDTTLPLPGFVQKQILGGVAKGAATGLRDFMQSS